MIDAAANLVDEDGPPKFFGEFDDRVEISRFVEKPGQFSFPG